MLPLRSWIVQECKKSAVKRQSLKDSDTLRRWDTEEGNQTDGAIDKVLWEQQARRTGRVGLRRYESQTEKGPDAVMTGWVNG